MKVKFFLHNLGNSEINEVTKALKSPFLTTGAHVDETEKLLAQYLKSKHAVGLTSCTAALHLSLLAAGLKSDDEVITTPMTFVASSNAIIMTGAKPVFVDVEKETGNIDPRLIEKAITKKTKAILPVHLYGRMVDLKRIISIAKKYKLIVIEDAAHALEAERDGIRPGQKTFGACFSFYATKSITSAEGGAFVTNNPVIKKLVTKLRSHGITSELAQRIRTGIRGYDVDVLGWKYNMDNIQGALLKHQIKKIDKIWKKRDMIAQKYRKAFEKHNILMPTEGKNERHGRHIFPIWVAPKKRNAIQKYLSIHGIETVINYPSINTFSLFKKKYNLKEGMFPISEWIGQSELSLPIYAKLKDKEIRHIIKHVIAACSI